MKRLVWLAIGLLVGVGLGLLLGWGLWPVQYYDTSPAELRPDFRDEYLVLTAVSYQLDRDLERATARLELLAPEAPREPLLTLIETLLAAESPPASALVPLIDLARALGSETPAMRAYLEGLAP